ncbi:Surp module family protein [Tritrichomonas foetus]|uniref:Surp module family protein n=1 Tax=Tritrichomonas foetus TaxID=1144522 RepID=A0A1J4JM55_9EUKA|nr:Surp module family protein [Tritrichomonas foetus]|eukprot:OHT00201.1 Surp module family protein [Tritrichomonas foetus]
MSDLIIPPKKVIKVIDTTVTSIAQWGDNLVRKILEDPKNAQKFSFLQPNDPFYPFYQMRLEEAKSGNKKQENASTASGTTSQAAQTPAAPVSKPIPAIIPPTFTYKHPPEIGGLQLDVIHLTAQYTALYGREFLQAIAKQEMNSPIFNFLKPDQPYFRLFTNLLDQYRLALDPSNQLKRRLEQESQSLLNVKTNLETEAEHAKMVIEQKKKEAAEAKKDESLEQYDWDEFNVLATINYDDDDDDENENSRKKNSEIDTQMVPRTLKGNKKAGITQISPITGQVVPIEEFGDHLRFEKVHPQYQKELVTMKERKANQNSSLANGDQIAANLKFFANGEAKPIKNPVMWDGREETIKLTVAEAVDRVNKVDEEQQIEHPELKREPKIIGPRFERKKKE